MLFYRSIPFIGIDKFRGSPLLNVFAYVIIFRRFMFSAFIIWKQYFWLWCWLTDWWSRHDAVSWSVFSRYSGTGFLQKFPQTSNKAYRAASIKARHHSPYGVSQPMGIQGYAPPKNFEIILCQWYDFMLTENEFFMTINVDVARNVGRFANVQFG